MKPVKKSFALLLSFLFIFILTACNSDSDYMGFMKDGWDGGNSGSTEEASSTLPEESEPQETEPDSTKISKKETPTKTQRLTNAVNPTSPTKATEIKTTSSDKVINALNLYKTAGNNIKSSKDSITCTKIKEVITEISGRIPENYKDFGFTPGTSTEKRIYDTPAKIKSGFCVEGKDYVCKLSAEDIKSVDISASGGNQIVTMFVKDDNAGTYNRSGKCVSTINIPGNTSTCKGVIVKGTINSAGQLISLYTKMPTYVTSGGTSFAFVIEQYWTITY